MKTEITDPNEIHLILLEKYQKSTVNIVVRAEIDYCATSTQLENATTRLVEKHPYLNARYFVEETSLKHKYFYEEISERQYEIEIRDTTNSELPNQMNSLSVMRTYLFSLENGELFKLVVYQGETRSIAELTIAHIVGEVPSALILMGDYLHYLDQSIAGLNEKVVKREKYFFHEQDFGWSNFNIQKTTIDDPGEHASDINPWRMPEAQLARHKLPAETFSQFSNWIASNNIDAKVSDIFYFIADKLLKETLNKSPDFWLIMSYRNLAQKQEIKGEIFNFAFFAPVMSTQFDNSDAKTWLEDFYQYRNHLITAKSISMSKSFWHNLNEAMEGTSLQLGKRIMDSVVKFPDFAFNNYGKIDQYIGLHSHFNVTDIDVQDGTPTQEIRYFSFKNELYVNPTFFTKDGINLELFWDKFSQELSTFITDSNVSNADFLCVDTEPVV